MPDWAVHLLVPFLALVLMGRKENHKYFLLLLPLAVLPDIDTFFTEHRALFHNIFIPGILVLSGLFVKKSRSIFLIAAVFLGSHVILDLFGGGVVLFYPVYNELAFINASLQINRENELIWAFNYGFSPYDTGWKIARGYISESTGTASLIFVMVAGIWAAYRKKILENEVE